MDSPCPSQKRTRKVEERQRSASEASDEPPPPEANVEEDRGQPGLQVARSPSSPNRPGDLRIWEKQQIFKREQVMRFSLTEWFHIFTRISNVWFSCLQVHTL
jgi:hypothetical protein